MAKTIGKLPKNWTEEELLQWAKDEVEAKVGDDDMRQFVVEKYELPGNSNTDQTKARLIEHMDSPDNTQETATGEDAQRTDAETNNSDSAEDRPMGPDESEQQRGTNYPSGEGEVSTEATPPAPEDEKTQAQAAQDAQGDKDDGSETEYATQHDKEQARHDVPEGTAGAQTSWQDVENARNPEKAAVVSGESAYGDTPAGTVPGRQGMNTQADDSQEFTQQEGPESAMEDNLKQYDELMKPGRSHSGGEGPATQLMLFRTIKMVLRQEGSTFNSMYGRLLEFVNERRDTHFSERYAYRYFDQLRQLSSTERQNFANFMNLMLATCDPATRAQGAEQVDIDNTMAGFNDPDAHQRVVGFYSGNG